MESMQLNFGKRNRDSSAPISLLQGHFGVGRDAVLLLLLLLLLLAAAEYVVAALEVAVATGADVAAPLVMGGARVEHGRHRRGEGGRKAALRKNIV